MPTKSYHDPDELPEIAFARRDRLPFQIEIMRLEELLRRRLDQDLTKPQRLQFHHLAYVEEGNSLHSVDFEPYPTGRGHLLIIPEGHVQAFSPDRVLRGYSVVFTQDFLRRCSESNKAVEAACDVLLRAGPHVHLQEDSFARAIRAVVSLSECIEAPPGRFMEDAIYATFSLLAFTVAALPETAASAAAHQPKDDLANQFLVQLERHYTTEHQAAFYAKALRVSVRTLDRHLLEALLQTTRQVIASRLVLEAKCLLTERGLLIKRVAHQLGFSEPHNFTRFFRTQTGVSPESFRASLEK